MVEADIETATLNKQKTVVRGRLETAQSTM